MKTIMIDMDEVIVRGRFSDFLVDFLGEVDFSKLNSFYRQDLIKGREQEFRKIYEYRNLYKNDDDTFVEPIENCVEVVRELSEKYDVYVLTHYTWKYDVINAEQNKVNKLEYLKHFFPFINSTHFVCCEDKTQFQFDVGIDDNLKYLSSCKTKFLFTEFRNKKITKSELDLHNATRVDGWLEVKKHLL